MLSEISRLWRWKGTKPGMQRAKRARPDTPDPYPYRGVFIKPVGHSCGAVRRLEGRPFLTKEAPLLPLDGCTNPDCKCRYVRFNDRRQDMRRDEDVGISSRMYVAKDRRSVGGRRKDDQH